MSTSGSQKSHINLETIAKGGSVESGSFLFDRSGQFIKRQDGGPLRLSFDYRDALYEVEVQTGADMRVRLTGLYGVLPYTAECSEIRPLLLKLIESSRNFKRGQLSVNADMQIELQAEASPPSPCTPESIMATVIALLLEFSSCVELLKDLLAAKAPLPSMDLEDPMQQLRTAAAAGRP